MPIKSALGEIDIPDVDIWTLLFDRQDRDFPGTKIVYVDADTNRSYTYSQVRSTALNFGKCLKLLWDWKLGDVLAIYSPNSIDLPAIIWGTIWAGGIISPANPLYTSNELAFQLKDSGAKAIVTQSPFKAIALKACREAGIDNSRIILIDESRDAGTKFKHFTDMLHIMSTTNVIQTTVNTKKDLAFLVYSSGTTGLPKGVMLTHKNVVSNILMTETIEAKHISWKGGRDNEGDKIVGFLPFFHIYGLVCLIHQTIRTGACLFVMPKFDLEKLCSLVQRQRITVAYVVPPVALLLAKSPVVSRYDLSSLRMLNSGAAPLSNEIIKAVYRRLKIPIKQGFGLSETSPVTHIQTWESWASPMGSVGLLLPNQTIMFMSADGKELPAGETGELWIKGPNVFQGYQNNPEATNNAFAENRYFKTGDIGYQDKDGNTFITDRIKELIKYKGFQVPPAELEGVLLSHPDIEDVAVIGVQDYEQATEVPRAYVVLRHNVGQTVETEKNIIEWVEKRLANHKHLRGGVRFIDVIPKSASGKILRRILKEQEKTDIVPRPFSKL